MKKDRAHAEMFLAFQDSVLVMPPGCLLCHPREAVLGLLMDGIESRREVIEEIIWRKRN